MSADRPRHLAIGLAWHSSNSGNLGIGALTCGHLDLIREAAAAVNVVPQFTLLGGRQREPDYVRGFASRVELTSLALILPHRSLRAIAWQDCLLDIGEGDGFSDIYGLKRLIRQIVLKAQAWVVGVPYVLAPQTVGPFSTWIGRRLARWTIRHARAVTVRDEASADIVRDLVPACDPLLATDVAFAMIAELIGLPPTSKIRVGINVSGLLFNRPHDADNIRTDFDHGLLMDELLQRLALRDDVEVHLFGHVRGGDPVDNDVAAAAHFAARYPGTVLVPPFPNPIAAKSWIAAMDMIVSARMHACIAAFSAGVPVVPLSYSPKFEGLFHGLSWPWLVPYQGMDQEGAVALVETAIDRLPELRHEMAIGRAEVVRRLDRYSDFLRTFLADVAATR